MSCGINQKVLDMEELVRFNESYDPVKNMNKSITDNTIDNVDINKSNIIILALLNWLQDNISNQDKDNKRDGERDNFDIRTLMDVNDDLNKLFQKQLLLQIRKQKIYNRKSLLLGVLKLSLEFVLDEKLDANVDLGLVREIKKFDTLYIESLKLLLRKKPTRNLSGITSITLITSPHPWGQTYTCKHDCFYCPNEKAHEGNNWQDQPRSYLFREPAVLRANRNDFLPFDQTISRLDTLYVNGHITDKLEFILEGGTYTEYPADYLEWFHIQLFYAANIYTVLKKLFNYGGISRESIDNENNIKNIAKKLGYTVEDGREYFVDANILQYLIDGGFIRGPGTIEEEVKYNETADVHIIGVCIETRPDAIDDEWIRRFRKWGVTRIQLGVQHTDNFILKKINRGHTIEQALSAIKKLKDNCFKIDIHIMPDLPYSTPEKDIAMFDYVYSVVCPDQMKIYPCQVTPWTRIEKWYSEGKYVPYFDKNPRDLIDVIKYAMLKCPNYIRLPRVIRDIPITYVGSGNKYPNMRQIIDDEFAKDGLKAADIRSREIGRNSKYYKKQARYNIYPYWANGGMEYFICYESLDKVALFGFIRLRLIDFNNPNVTREVVFDCLKGCGLIRELHVYGNTNQVGRTNVGGGQGGNECVQHTGIGKNLLKIAEIVSMKNGYGSVAVISGEGVKGYYKKNGYYEEDTFMIKKFNPLMVMFYYIWNIVYNNLKIIKSYGFIILFILILLSYQP